MVDSIGMVLLAAGKGTRLKVDIAKPLCPALGLTLVDYVLQELKAFSESSSLKAGISLVVGHKKEELQEYLESNKDYGNGFLQYAWQEEQLGTGHALQTYFNAIDGAWNHRYTLVVCADTPLITSEVYQEMLEELIRTDADAVCATFNLDKPQGYGRIELGQNEKGFSIIEEKDASLEQKKISEVNSALYIFKTSYIKEHLFNLENKNNSNEFYLTDLFRKSANVVRKVFSNYELFQGVNNLVQLEAVSQVLQKRVVEELQLKGVRFLNSSSVYIEPSVEIAAETIIYPNVCLMGDTKISHKCIIEAGCTIKNSILGENVLIKSNSYLDEASIGASVSVGPMAHLRPGSIIGDDCRLGNFVEIKKSELKQGSKVSHLSYVGDAEIGENTNIGCGFITCNYDGANKHKTVIGADSFIGSDCQLIAPINIGKESYIGSGSTVNQDVPDGAFAIARQRQVIKEGMAKRFIKKKK